MEFINGAMEIYILVNGLIIREKDKVNSNDQMEIYMKEYGNKINWMV